MYIYFLLPPKRIFVLPLFAFFYKHFLFHPSHFRCHLAPFPISLIEAHFSLQWISLAPPHPRFSCLSSLFLIYSPLQAHSSCHLQWEEQLRIAELWLAEQGGGFCDIVMLCRCSAAVVVEKDRLTVSSLSLSPYFSPSPLFFIFPFPSRTSTHTHTRTPSHCSRRERTHREAVR